MHACKHTCIHTYIHTYMRMGSRPKHRATYPYVQYLNVNSSQGVSCNNLRIDVIWLKTTNCRPCKRSPLL